MAPSKGEGANGEGFAAGLSGGPATAGTPQKAMLEAIASNVGIRRTESDFLKDCLA